MPWFILVRFLGAHFIRIWSHITFVGWVMSRKNGVNIPQPSHHNFPHIKDHRNSICFGVSLTTSWFKHNCLKSILFFIYTKMKLNEWMKTNGATVHWGSGPANRLLSSRPLVHRQKLTILLSLYGWYVINTSRPQVEIGFLDRDYRYKSVVIQIPLDAALVPIPHTDRKFLSHRRTNQRTPHFVVQFPSSTP